MTAWPLRIVVTVTPSELLRIKGTEGVKVTLALHVAPGANAVVQLVMPTENSCMALPETEKWLTRTALVDVLSTTTSPVADVPTTTVPALKFDTEITGGSPLWVDPVPLRFD